MNDEEIRAAYGRMATSVQPPADALDRVGARVRRRRRTRSALTAGLAVAVLAGAGGVAAATLGDDGADRRSDVRATDSASVTPTAPAAGPPSSVECSSVEALRSVVFDHAGHRTFTRLAVESGAVDQAAWVDRESETIWLLRDDGTAQVQVPWMGGGRSRWFPDGRSWCKGEGRGPAPATESVTVEVGHCWIEPVEVAGSTWDVVEEDQGGWGGGLRDDFAGTGEAWTAGDVAFYRDAGGAVLTLVPEGDPWALDRPQACR